MSPGASLVGISIPAWAALLVAYWPSVWVRLAALYGLRLRVVEVETAAKWDDGTATIRVLVVARADGYDYFVCKLPSRDGS